MAVSADDSAAGWGEKDGVFFGDRGAATYADVEFGHKTGVAEDVELKGEEGFLKPWCGQFGEDLFQQIEDFWMRIVFLEQKRDQFGGIDGEEKGAEVVPEIEMAFFKFPVGEELEFSGIIRREDGLAGVEEIDSAVESAGAGFGFSMSAFGHGAKDAVLAGEQSEDLRGLTKFGFAEANTAVGNEGHIGIIVEPAMARSWRSERV